MRIRIGLRMTRFRTLLHFAAVWKFLDGRLEIVDVNRCAIYERDSKLRGSKLRVTRSGSGWLNDYP